MLSLIIIFSFLVATSVMANGEQEEIQRLLNIAEKNKQLYMNEANRLKEQSLNYLQKSINTKNLGLEVQSCVKQHWLSSEPEIDHKFLIFISFSMPKLALQSLYADSKNQNAVLLIRGLKGGSFKETAEYLKTLDISVQIDPEAFKKYQINRVPTIVLLRNNKFDSVSGNISFQYAKQKLLEIEQ